jgi:hypothetical protein
MEAAVNAFNARLAQGGQRDWRLPETHVPRFPRMQGRHLFQEMYLTLDHGEIRGGYALTHNQFAVRGQMMALACGPQFNLSEGVVNRSFGMVGLLQLQDALRRQPLLYGLGLGGMQEPLARLLAAMRWTLFPVPFYFRVLNAAAFLDNIAYLKTRSQARFAVDLLRRSRLGPIGVRMAQLRLPRRNSALRADVVPEFGSWANSIWERCSGQYSLIGLRDEDSLNLYYPAESRFLRLRVFKGSQLIGWAVTLDMQMSNHKHFGNLRVGMVLDCLSLPRDAEAVVQSATRHLTAGGVDLIVSNQTSATWGRAFINAGYLRGPSNFILALSPALLERLQPLQATRDRIHINRGDPAELPYSDSLRKREAAEAAG